jgi:hypothetical protein
MNEMTTTPPATTNPFARTGLQPHVSAGAVAIEQERAIAEAQGKLVIAKKFPRDQAVAYQRIMDACSRPALADDALYAYPRGGQTVSGPSIRLAEELARCWGNIDYGMKELSRRDGETEMEAYAWDLETNTYTAQKFTVKHLRDKQGGAKVLTDERDIYEIGANMGARRMRARILAVIPGDIVDAAVAKCRDTMKGNSEMPMADRIRTLVSEFGKLGVASTLIERRFGRKTGDLLPEDLADLRAIFKSLRDGMSKASDWFGDATGTPSESKVAAAVNQAVAATQAPILTPEEAQAGQQAREAAAAQADRTTGEIPVAAAPADEEVF